MKIFLQSIRGRRNSLEEVIASSPEAIVGVTPEGIITSWNAAAEQISGYTAREMIGRHVSTMATAETRAEQTAWFAQACRGAQVRPYEMTPAGKDGSRSESSLCFAPILLS